MMDGKRFAGVCGGVRLWSALWSIVMLSVSAAAAQPAVQADPVCIVGAKRCLAMALDAMGGAARLDGVKSMSYTSFSNTALTEQSYRQEPFISSYERTKTSVDLAGNRLRVESTLTWPESDPGQSESHSTMVADGDGCVNKADTSAASAAPAPVPDRPCSLAQIDEERGMFALGPLRLLKTAMSASDLRVEPPQTLRSTPHAVVAFTWQGTLVRILLNIFNHLPDAVETVEQFHDFWYFWGDVHRRIYLDNWQTFRGVRIPTNLVEERNGVLWKSTQWLDVQFDPPIDPALFTMDAKVAALGAQSKGWERPFNPKSETQLAPGITLFPGAWNSTRVTQDDGIVVLEAPISGTYTGGVIAEAKKRYPDLPIKAALSTSDSWPHVGGVRQAVASKLPVYILDLNQPLLDRMVAAKHEIHPDALAQSPQKPEWKIVSQKTVVGSGANRIELYPLRGACTERQYMVYFPEHQLLYASDTLALNDDGSLYDPELMREVVEAVQREGLQVKTVFAMHQGPVAWSDMVGLVEKALK